MSFSFDPFNRISQSTSIVVKDQQLQHQHSVTAHRNQSKPIVDDQKFAKYLMKNDNATRLIPSEINDSPSNINTSANHPHVIVDTEQSTLLNDNTNSKPCPLEPSDLTGPIDVAIEYESLESIAQRFHGRVEPGGYYKPIECTQVNNRVAIVIPYRDKLAHLSIFLKNMHPFLQKQQADYGIFVVEQFGSGLFNRAALLNIGFLEARKLSQWDCFIFHDVDLIPLDNRNLYRCPKQPRHMSVAVDTMQFKYVSECYLDRLDLTYSICRLPYSSIFGGVSAMTVDQFQSVNGFSNAFEGWGGEDDDMSNRFVRCNVSSAA